MSIAMQTLKPLEVIIVDDTDIPVDIRTLSQYKYILQLFDDKDIKWKVLFGVKKGQHHSHQMIQDEAKGEYIFRIDDDEVAEPNVLESLMVELDKDPTLGAVGPAVLMPGATELDWTLPCNFIASLNRPNIQWFKFDGFKYVEHLYSCFMYRKGLVRYDLTLSLVAHREETIFSHSILRKGYGLMVQGSARVWHFRSETGGIRSHKDSSLYEHDERIFKGYLNLWNVNSPGKVIVLDNGVGDHCAFKNLLPRLREKYKDLTIAACFPEVFFDEPDLKLISIAEAKLMFGDIDPFQIYKWAWDNNWKGILVSVYEKLYLL